MEYYYLCVRVTAACKACLDKGESVPGTIKLCEGTAIDAAFGEFGKGNGKKRRPKILIKQLRDGGSVKASKTKVFIQDAMPTKLGQHAAIEAFRDDFHEAIETLKNRKEVFE